FLVCRAGGDLRHLSLLRSTSGGNLTGGSSMQRCHLSSDPHLGSWNGLLRHVADGPPDLGTGGSNPAAYYTQLLRHVHRCGWTAFACRGSDPCASQPPCGVPAHLHCKGRSFD
ncbi:unnamed protein product, partial [Symbiodinium necroappetens]